MAFKRLKIKRLTKKLKAMQVNRIHNQPSDEVLVKEVALYHQLGEIYSSLIGHKHFPYASEMKIACLRAAAEIDDSNAQYQLGKKFIEEARFREQLQRDELFASISNERQMNQLYAEALAYLESAEKLGHVEARRLHGLCYINGWGLLADKNKGFELVVESIEQENSWDRVPQIFAAIGLNKPEFFSALMKHRNKT